ncbi:hypothetical protein PCE1_003233 [Barthelona sp. PCE]
MNIELNEHVFFSNGDNGLKQVKSIFKKVSDSQILLPSSCILTSYRYDHSLAEILASLTISCPITIYSHPQDDFCPRDVYTINNTTIHEVETCATECFHPKIWMIFFPDNSMRLVITSANLVIGDFQRSVNAFWYKDLPAKIGRVSKNRYASNTFRNDLYAFLQDCGIPSEVILGFDFSFLDDRIRLLTTVPNQASPIVDIGGECIIDEVHISVSSIGSLHDSFIDQLKETLHVKDVNHKQNVFVYWPSLQYCVNNGIEEQGKCFFQPSIDAAEESGVLCRFMPFKKGTMSHAKVFYLFTGGVLKYIMVGSHNLSISALGNDDRGIRTNGYECSIVIPADLLYEVPLMFDLLEEPKPFNFKAERPYSSNNVKNLSRFVTPSLSVTRKRPVSMSQSPYTQSQSLYLERDSSICTQLFGTPLHREIGSKKPRSQHTLHDYPSFSQCVSPQKKKKKKRRKSRSQEQPSLLTFDMISPTQDTQTSPVMSPIMSPTSQTSPRWSPSPAQTYSMTQDSFLFSPLGSQMNPICVE